MNKVDGQEGKCADNVLLRDNKEGQQAAKAPKVPTALTMTKTS